MLKLVFSASQIAELKDQRFNHPHPRVRRKMEALLLKSENLPHARIQKLVGVSPNTLLDYFRQFQNGGVEALKELTFYRPVSTLAPFQSTLEAYFREHPVVSIKQAGAAIKELTGLSVSPTAVGNFLRKIGLRRRKVGSIPAKADPQKQAVFLEQELLPRLEQAQQEKRRVFLSTPPTLS